ncbi:LysR substrate binding domain protein [compost metagenome]
MQQAGDDLGRPLRLRIRVRSFDAMCQMVSAGLGIAVLPKASVQPLLSGMDLQQVRLNDEWAKRKLLIGARSFDTITRPVRILMDHLL